MAPVSSQLLVEVTAHAQSDSLADTREICAEGTYFPNNLRKMWVKSDEKQSCIKTRTSLKIVYFY